jgi:hypothetical protein
LQESFVLFADHNETRRAIGIRVDVFSYGLGFSGRGIVLVRVSEKFLGIDSQFLANIIEVTSGKAIQQDPIVFQFQR